MNKFYGFLTKAWKISLAISVLIILACLGIKIWSYFKTESWQNYTARQINPLQQSVQICVSEDFLTVTDLQTGKIQILSTRNREGVIVSPINPIPFTLTTDEGGKLTVLRFIARPGEDGKYQVVVIQDDHEEMVMTLPRCFTTMGDQWSPDRRLFMLLNMDNMNNSNGKAPEEITNFSNSGVQYLRYAYLTPENVSTMFKGQCEVTKIESFDVDGGALKDPTLIEVHYSGPKVTLVEYFYKVQDTTDVFYNPDLSATDIFSQSGTCSPK